MSILMAVLLPALLGAVKARISPSVARKEIWSTALTPVVRGGRRTAFRLLLKKIKKF